MVAAVSLVEDHACVCHRGEGAATGTTRGGAVREEASQQIKLHAPPCRASIY